MLLKSKPAPLRPAVFPSLRQNQSNQRQSQEQYEHQESATMSSKHKVEVRGLISSADSARRLSQGKEGYQKASVDSHYHRQHYQSPQEPVDTRPIVRKVYKLFDIVYIYFPNPKNHSLTSPAFFGTDYTGAAYDPSHGSRTFHSGYGKERRPTSGAIQAQTGQMETY